MANHYSLDTVGNLFPAVQGEDNSSFFRIAVILKDTVDPEIYQKAVESVYQRFSFFFARLRRGVFWNYLEESSELCIVQEEKELPCSPMKAEKGKSNLIRFLYFGNRISIEISHIITDGTGCLEILKAVLYSYIKLLGNDIDADGKILSLDSIPTIKDYESSFSRYVQTFEHSKKQKKIAHRKAYRIKGFSPIETGSHVFTALASVKSVKEASKKYNTTITGFLCSLLMFAIYSSRIKYEKNKRPLVVAMPVNLRSFFPSETLKNFFAVPNVKYIFSHDSTFEELIENVNVQMKTVFTKENLEQEITRYTNFETKGLTSFIPLAIKNAFIRLGFSLWGESKKTITLTNVGIPNFPQGMNPYIEHVEAVLYPTKLSPINGAIASFNDTLSISFSLAINETDILRTFFTFLQEYTESPVSVYSTRKGD